MVRTIAGGASKSASPTNTRIGHVMSDSDAVRSAITTPPSRNRLSARMLDEFGEGRSRVAHPRAGLEELALWLARQQRLPVVQREQEGQVVADRAVRGHPVERRLHRPTRHAGATEDLLLGSV